MKRSKGGLLAQYGLSYLFLLFLILFAVFPAIWMFVTSIKPMSEIFQISAPVYDGSSYVREL